MFLICAFNREHDLQIYSNAQWLILIQMTQNLGNKHTNIFAIITSNTSLTLRMKSAYIDIGQNIGRLYAKMRYVCDKLFDISFLSRCSLIYDPLLERPFHKAFNVACCIFVRCIAAKIIALKKVARPSHDLLRTESGYARWFNISNQTSIQC